MSAIQDLLDQHAEDTRLITIQAIRIMKLEEIAAFYAKRYHDEKHVAEKIKDCTSEVCQSYMETMRRA